MDEANDNLETVHAAPPHILVYVCHQVIEFFAAYGWYFLALSLIILYYWERIQNLLEQRYRKQSEKEYEAKCKKDPDWLQRRQKEMEAARKRMQEELDRKAAEHATKLKEKEEQKRAAIIASNTSGGQKLGYGGETTKTTSKSETKSSTKPYRPEYHPLMGGGSSGGYRPPRRGCPGGGCG